MSMHDESGGATQILAGLLQARTGQVISSGRYWRVETSLKPVLAEYCIPDIDTLVAALLGADNDDLVQSCVEAMLNNESYFFRDTAMFTMIRTQVMPVLQKARADSRRLRIWCAGCSTGQEAYSLAMQFADDRQKWAGWDIEIVGTDISNSVLERARSGRYNQFEIQRGLSVARMLRYFRQDGEDWEINSDIRAMVKFRTDNITRPSGNMGQFDLILCRNVLLYFAPETRHMAFSRLARSLGSDGYLMLGAAETVIGQTTSFNACREIRGVYTLQDATRTDRPVLDTNWPFAQES